MCATISITHVTAHTVNVEPLQRTRIDVDQSPTESPRLSTSRTRTVLIWPEAPATATFIGSVRVYVSREIVRKGCNPSAVGNRYSTRSSLKKTGRSPSVQHWITAPGSWYDG